VKDSKRTWFVGNCKYCKEKLFNTDSFATFGDRTNSHYECMEKENIIKQNNGVIKNA